MMNRILQRSKIWRNLEFRRTLFIQTQDTPNPHSLKFVPDENVLRLPDGVEQADFPSSREGTASPLARRLFAIDGVRSVFVTRDFVSVNKAEESRWPELTPQVYAALMEFAAEGETVVDTACGVDSNTRILPGDSEVVQMIKELLDLRIRPAVQGDGGDVRFVRFDENDGIVYLMLQGSCSGCPSSGVTLKNHIERMLMHWIMEVNAVVAVDADDLTRLNEQVFRELDDKLENKS